MPDERPPRTRAEGPYLPAAVLHPAVPSSGLHRLLDAARGTTAATDPRPHGRRAAGSDFWRQPFVQNVLPFLTSLAFHATVLLLGVLTYQVVQIAITQDAPQTVVPDAAINDGPAGDGAAAITAWRGPADDASVRPEQNADPTAAPDANGWSPTRGEDFNSFDAGGGADDGPVQSGLIALGPGSSGKRNGRFGGGDGDGGWQARYNEMPRIGGSTDTIFPGSMGGTGKRIKSIAYVCDASGSMISKFDVLRQELHESVQALAPVQTFNIIFFQESNAGSVSKGEMLPATSANKRKAEKFLFDFGPAGETDPIPALELAFRQKPELIWLLTDGDFRDNAAVLQFIRTHNAGGKVRINTIAFMERGETYEDVLKTIAEENGGEFRYVDEEDLN